MTSIFSPDQVLQAVELGIDMFDSTYPYLVTEKGSALVFDFSYVDSHEVSNEDDNKKTNKSEGKGYYIDLNEKQ